VHGLPLEARCGREVIVSCGSVQSPGVLEHSGIGQPELLRRHGIEVKHELKGVGENYGDHFAPRMNWRCKADVSTLNQETRGLNLVKEVLKYYTTGRGALSLTAGVVYGFVRTRPGLETPDMQFHMAHASYDSAQKRLLEREPGMTVVIGQCRPDSRGSIHIKSAIPGSEPAIRPNFLSAQTDRDATVAGMQIARKIVSHPSMAKYIAFENNPGDKVQSYDEWLDFARRSGQTTYHVIGTCKMGSDPMAVVDDRLRVHGIAGLRVIDASIMPTVPSGNTNAPTIMVAEKGADMLKQDAKAGVKLAA
jgi:choline dehydrogenase